MKKFEKVWSVINIVMMLTSIAVCVANKNIQAVSGWVIALGWYLVHLKDEVEYERLIRELKNVYEMLRNARK